MSPRRVLRRFILASLLLCGLAGHVVRGQGPVRRPAIEEAIVNLEMARATQLSLLETDPKLQWYYQTRILFVRYLVQEDPAVMTAFLSHSKSALDFMQGLPESDPEKDVMAAEVFFLRGAVKALDKKNVAAAIDIKSACTLVYNNSQAFPKNKEQLKLLGIFNVGMSAVPKKLRWLSDVLCFNGDLDLGLRQLAAAARGSSLLPMEAQVMLFYFEKNMLGKPEAAVQRARALVEAHPQSIVAHYLLVAGYLETRQTDLAADLIESKEAALLGNPEVVDLPIWHHSRAKVHFCRLEYDACIAEIDKFLAGYRGKTLQADALYRKAMSLALSGRYEASRPIFRRLVQGESSSFDVDEYARAQAAVYLLRPPTRNEQELYEARNLFDGGMYLRSLQVLRGVQERLGACNDDERCELWYRYGRNWQELDSAGLAQRCYGACLQTLPARNRWMKAYAHYYLGKLEEERGQFAAARQQYHAALGYDNYDYQSGLEQRCKAALAQLKGKN